MSKKVKVLLICVLLGGLVYINRAEIKDFIAKLPFIGNDTSVSDTVNNRGSYEYYFNGNIDSNTDNIGNDELAPWQMSSKN